VYEPRPRTNRPVMAFLRHFRATFLARNARTHVTRTGRLSAAHGEPTSRVREWVRLYVAACTRPPGSTGFSRSPKPQSPAASGREQAGWGGVRLVEAVFGVTASKETMRSHSRQRVGRALDAHSFATGPRYAERGAYGRQRDCGWIRCRMYGIGALRLRLDLA